MTVQELTARFPEIPQDLQAEALLAQFADTFDDLLRLAQNPTNCSSEYEPGHYYYLKLIGPLKLYMYGLSTREKVLGQVQALLERQAADPSGFAASLVASGTSV